MNRALFVDEIYVTCLLLHLLSLFMENRFIKHFCLYKFSLSFKTYIFILFVLFGFSGTKAEPRDKHSQTVCFVSSWKTGLGFYDCVINIDSAGIINATRISQKKERDLECKIYNGMIVNAYESDSISVNFTCKSNNIAVADLIIQSYDTHGLLCYSDSIDINPRTNDAEFFSIKQPCFDTSYLRFTMHIKGKNNELNQNFHFTDMQIKLPSRAYVSTLPKDIMSNKQDIIPLSFDDSLLYHKIPRINSVKILALGESIHGGLSISQSVIQMMKHRILHSDCKLILLELPFDISLGINRYVQGDARYGLEVMSSLKYALYPKELCDFFIWVKKHNDTKSEKDKVWVLGVDIPNADFFSFGNNLFSYFYPIFKEHLDNAEIKRFLHELLVNSRKALSETLPGLMAKNKPSNIQFSEKEIALLQKWFSFFTSIENSELNMTIERDRLMYESICFFIQQVCSPQDNVTIYSHMAHACSNNTNSLYTYTKSFGTLLKQKYVSDYLCIGFITKSGKNLVLSQEGYVIQSLKLPPKNSIEAMMSEYGDTYFYRSTSQLAFPVYIRYGQYFTSNDFNIIYPRQYFDGIIFIESCDPIKNFRYEVKVKDKVKETIDEYQRHLDLINGKDVGL